MRGQKNCFKAFDGLWKRPLGVFKRLENGAPSAEKHCFISSQSRRGYVAATSPVQVGHRRSGLLESLGPGMVNRPFGSAGTNYLSCRCKHSSNSVPDLNRDFFAQLWVEDRKRMNVEAERQRVKQVSRQPLMSQPVTGSLEPSSSEEAQLAPLLARSNLLITRDIEWANLTFGFEQENRYAIVDIYHPLSPVGYIREQSNLIMRQFLRSRRPFVASITDALGNELFRVRRPFWWINSSIYTEVNGKEIGVVHRRWHLWRRIYDLYLGNEQFAVVENPGFWNWTFTLKDINGEVLAEIDRNWRGFGFELLTDAGQYAIRFGATDSSSHYGEIQELDVKYPLTLAQRAVAVALAVSLDNDYFSRHGGWALPFFVVGE